MIRLPDTITEAEVLAMIENDMASLPAERREAVRAAVASDPALARLVGESRRDATATVSMARVSAPASVRVKVIEELRRPAPARDIVREPEGGEIPVSTVIVSRESGWRRFAERMPVRKLAAAASLVMAAGLGVYLISNAARLGGNGKSSSGPIALVETPPAPSPVMPRPAGTGDTPMIAAVPDPLLEAIPAPVTPAPDGGPTAIADATPSSPAPAGMDPAEAVQLALQGRLVIRIRAVEPKDVSPAIDLVAASSRDMRWRPLQAWELTEVAMAVRGPKRPPAPYAAAEPPKEPTEPPKELTPEVKAPVVEPQGTAADVAAALSDEGALPLYTVELDDNRDALAGLLLRLAEDKTRVAEFVALERPLVTVMPSTDPAAVFWWSGPPEARTRRICVPIVLDQTKTPSP